MKKYNIAFLGLLMMIAYESTSTNIHGFLGFTSNKEKKDLEAAMVNTQNIIDIRQKEIESFNNEQEMYEKNYQDKLKEYQMLEAQLKQQEAAKAQEAARAKAEQEAAKAKAEQEAAKAKADLEAAKAEQESKVKIKVNVHTNSEPTYPQRGGGGGGRRR